MSVLLIDSVFRTDKNYYPQVFLEEYKYVVKEKRFLSILLTIKNFFLILIEKILIKKNSHEENSDKAKSYEENSDKDKFWWKKY